MGENLARLDKLEKDANGDDTRHQAIICQVLARETYPSILRKFGFPDHEQVLQFTIDLMLDTDKEWSAAHTWAETEIMMRNKKRMKASVGNLLNMYRHDGKAPLEWA